MINVIWTIIAPGTQLDVGVYWKLVCIGSGVTGFIDEGSGACRQLKRPKRKAGRKYLTEEARQKKFSASANKSIIGNDSKSTLFVFLSGWRLSVSSLPDPLCVFRRSDIAGNFSTQPDGSSPLGSSFVKVREIDLWKLYVTVAPAHKITLDSSLTQSKEWNCHP